MGPSRGARFPVDHEVRQAVGVVQLQRADESEGVERGSGWQASIGAAEAEDELEAGGARDPQERSDGGCAVAGFDPRERGLRGADALRERSLGRAGELAGDEDHEAGADGVGRGAVVRLWPRLRLRLILIWV